MSNSNFVITPATTNPSGIKSLKSIIPTCPFFDTAGNLDMNGLALIGNASSATTATNVTITEDGTTNASFYPVFVSNNTGNLALKVDKTTTPLSYNPSTGEFLSQSFAATITNGTVFSRLSSTQLQVASVPSNIVTITSNQITVFTSGTGTTTITPASVTSTSFIGALSGNATTATTATNATNAVIGTDNVSTLVYPTFVKTSGTGNKGLFIDDTTTTLSFNPSTGNFTTTTFTGALSGNATTATNIAGGLGGQIPYQSAVNTTAFLANGNSGQFLQSNGTTLAPSWVNQNTAATPSGIPVSGGTQPATLSVNFNNSFSSVTRYALTYSPSGTNVYTINNYALSGGVSGGQYELTIEITIPSNAGITYTFNGTGLTTAPVPKTNFTTITTGNVNGPTIRYIVLRFLYNGTNYFLSGSNFT